MTTSAEEMVVYGAIRRSFEMGGAPGSSLNPGHNQFTPMLNGVFDLLKAAKAAIEALDQHRLNVQKQALKEQSDADRQAL